MRAPGATFAAAASVLLFGAEVANAHTWVDSLFRVGSKGHFIGQEGFMRGSPDPACTADCLTNKHEGAWESGNKFPAKELVCHRIQQVKDYSNSLKAAAGDTIAVVYKENGHVSLDTNQRPPHNGTIRIYGTLNPKPQPEEKLVDIVNVWTRDGTLEKGKLLATRYYDDGWCTQVDAGNAIQRARIEKNKAAFGAKYEQKERYCQNIFKLPEDVPAGKTLALYWVWEYTRVEIKATEYEWYSSCMDVKIVDDCDGSLGEEKGPKCASGGVKNIKLDLASGVFNKVAVPEQLTMDNYQVEAEGGGGDGGGGNGSGGSGNREGNGNDNKTKTNPGRSTSTGAPRPGQTNLRERVLTVTRPSGVATTLVTAHVPRETEDNGGRPQVKAFMKHRAVRGARVPDA